MVTKIRTQKYSASLFVCLVTISSGCAETNSSVEPEDFNTVPQCSAEGDSCPCAGGSTGTCTYGSCDCPPNNVIEKDTCPSFSGDVAPEFTACGGEPFGTWNIVSVETKGFQFWVNGAFDSRQCPTQSLESSKTPALHFRLGDEGVGEVFSDGTRVTGEVQKSCAYPNSSYSFTCEDLSQVGTKCVSEACGICLCSSSLNDVNNSIEWSRTGTQVTIGNFGTFDYCVQGTKMQLRHKAYGITYVVERSYLVGTPDVCENRTQETCATGKGCHVGLCIGSSECSTSTSESSCTNRIGCSWDPGKCGGVAATSCEFEDYGVVPGCRITTTVPSCVGTPVPCSQQSKYNCDYVPGCSVGGICSGGTVDCGYHDDVIPACICSNSGECSGSYTCESLDKKTCKSARAAIYCSWEDETCLGTATPCSQLRADECNSIEGCSLKE